MVDQNMNVNDLKITFYSTSPPEYSKSKYPKQNKTSYRMPSTSMTMGANITIPAHVQEEEPLGTHRSLPREKRKTESKNNEKKTTKEKKKNTDTSQSTRSHPIRIRTAPNRYEPDETVTDDYRADEHDSESDYSSD
jgi:hypothetical protein